MDIRSYKELMLLRASLLKQSDVSSILTKHVFFSKFKLNYNANMVFSPLSIQIILGLIANGSSGSTLDQLLGFLKFKSVEELNSVYSRVIDDVLADGSHMGGPRLAVANGAWIDQSMSFKQSFKQVMDNVYKAFASSVDFKHKAEEIADEINKWGEEETNGLIKQILPPGEVTTETQLILANALYFKGAWNDKLNASDTKDHEFHLLNGKSVQAPLMTSMKMQYVRAFPGFKVLKLPYKRGEDKRLLSMYMFLPDARDGLPALLEEISSKPGFLNKYILDEKVRVRKFLIPKFKITFDIEASNVLKGLGLILPFKDGLTEMVGGDYSLAVSKVFHKAFIEVNEEGTEAAAVTAVSFVELCSRKMAKEEEIEFVADHPFLFLVKDDTCGAVLFIGTLLNPLAV